MWYSYCMMKPRRSGRYKLDPDPQEIAEECARIQATWSPAAR
jgi:hypothetical protein